MTPENLINIFPPENFASFSAMQGDRAVVGSFNMGYGKYKMKGKYPWCLKIAIALGNNNLYSNCLPNDIELIIVGKLEDELLAEIKKITIAHYIGHLYNDTFLDIYFYLDYPKEVYDYLKSKAARSGNIRNFACEITDDPKWKEVSAFLN